MDKVPTEVAMQQPMLYLILVFCLAMVGLVLGVVYVCFRNMRADRAETRSYIEANTKFLVTSISSLGDACHEHQVEVLGRIESRDSRNDAREERSLQIQEKCSTALASNSEVLRELRDIMQDRRKLA